MKKILISPLVARDTLCARDGKYHMQGVICGRSMVEMLGVLAIIGVLSVGAVSGYQKAIFKHKLNKQVEQISQLINATHILFTRVDSSHVDSTTLLYLFQKMNLIPDGVEIVGNTAYDVFKNEITFFHGTTLTSISIRFQPNTILDKSAVIKSCVHIMSYLKEYAVYNSATFGWVSVANHDDKGSPSMANTFYGPRVISSCRTSPCLKDTSLMSLSQTCQQTVNAMKVPNLFIDIKFYAQ